MRMKISNGSVSGHITTGLKKEGQAKEPKSSPEKAMSGRKQE